jgi:hypothetical protein
MKALFGSMAGLMPRADGVSAAPALGDPARDGPLVRAGLKAELGGREVAGLVRVAFMAAHGYAGDFG